MQVSERIMNFPFTDDGIKEGCKGLINDVAQRTGDCAVRVIFQEQTKTKGECSVEFTRDQTLEGIMKGNGTKLVFNGLSNEHREFFEKAIKDAGICFNTKECNAPVFRTKAGGRSVDGTLAEYIGIRGLTKDAWDTFFPNKPFPG